MATIAALCSACMALCLFGSCKRLPNPETDEVSRMLRHFDRAQRPGGQDVPLERYFAWASERDAGTVAPTELAERLQLLVNQQRDLIARVRRLRTNSRDGLAILEAYLGAHIDGERAMDEVLAAYRLGNAEAVQLHESSVGAALTRFRGAQKLRAEVTKRLGVADPANRAPEARD